MNPGDCQLKVDLQVFFCKIPPNLVQRFRSYFIDKLFNLISKW